MKKIKEFIKWSWKPVKWSWALVKKCLYFLLIKSKKRRYATIYFLLIPIFALIYLKGLSGQFYHATVPFEPSIRETENFILDELKSHITETFVTINHTNLYPIDNEWAIDADTFQTYKLEITDTEMKFNLDFMIKSNAPEAKKMSYAPTITFQLNNWSEDTNAADAENQRRVMIFRPISLESPDLSWDDEEAKKLAKILFPQSPPQIKTVRDILSVDKNKTPKDKIVIPIPKGLNEKIFELVKGKKGNPSMLKGNFWRMSYLSAVTITTLGYGDIAPTTTAARIAVSVEAIWGIILIGLFLNAVANDGKK